MPLWRYSYSIFECNSFLTLWQLSGKGPNRFICHDDTYEGVRKANIEHDTHEHLKVVKFVGFTGRSEEVELLLKLVEIAVSLETIIIDVRLPSDCWFWKDYFSFPEINYRQNRHAEMCRNSAHKLKTQIRPQIDVLII